MFNLFQRLLPHTGDFFGMFEAHAATIVAAGDALKRLIDDGGANSAEIEEIHRSEHEADDIIRTVLRTVRKTFLTPFDRGAITSLIVAMDDAIDEMQSTARAADVYSLQAFEPEMKQMAAMIAEASHQVAEAIPLLRNITRYGERIHAITENIVKIEGEADIVHATGLKRAYEENKDNSPIRFAVAREIYKHLERITDAFEDVANEIDGIVIDHA
ncbi:MAG: DUF47 domain-containing protein [Sphingomicrobium sp.]